MVSARTALPHTCTVYAMSASMGDQVRIVQPQEINVRVLIMVGLTAVYAVCFVVIREGLDYASPLVFAGLRTIIAGVSLLGLVAALRQPLIPPRTQWPWILVLAATATAASYGAMFVSPDRGGVGIASVLGNLQPLFVIGLAAPLLGERLTGSDRAVLVLGVLGAVLIAVPALRGDNAYGLSGPVLAVAASLGFAIGSVVVKRMNITSGLLTLTGWQLFLGSLPLLLASTVFERDEPVRWTVEFLLLLLFLAIIGTALVTAVWYWLVQREEVGQLTLFFFLVPVFGLALAAVIYGEAIGRTEAAGVALIFAGIAVAIARSWGDIPKRSS